MTSDSGGSGGEYAVCEVVASCIVWTPILTAVSMSSLSCLLKMDGLRWQGYLGLQYPVIRGHPAIGDTRFDSLRQGSRYPVRSGLIPCPVGVSPLSVPLDQGLYILRKPWET